MPYYYIYGSNEIKVATTMVSSIVYYNRKKNKYNGFKIWCDSDIELNKYVWVDVENSIMSKIYEEIITKEDIKNELFEKDNGVVIRGDNWKEVFLYYKNLLKKNSD